MYLLQDIPPRAIYQINKRFIPTHREDNKRKEINLKKYEEWTKGLWRDLFG
jgi:hypothetical protein